MVVGSFVHSSKRYNEAFSKSTLGTRYQVFRFFWIIINIANQVKEVISLTRVLIPICCSSLIFKFAVLILAYFAFGDLQILDLLFTIIRFVSWSDFYNEIIQLHLQCLPAFALIVEATLRFICSVARQLRSSSQFCFSLAIDYCRDEWGSCWVSLSYYLNLRDIWENKIRSGLPVGEVIQADVRDSVAIANVYFNAFKKDLNKKMTGWTHFPKKIFRKNWTCRL